MAFAHISSSPAKLAALLSCGVAVLCAPATAVTAQEQSRQSGAQEAAQQLLFVILYRPGPNWAANVPMSEQGLLEHFYYIRGLHRSGRILVAGPLGDTGGLIILRVANQSEAEAIMRADPAVTSGKFVGSVTPFVARFPGAIE
jgi:uncharacterized protein YciI